MNIVVTGAAGVLGKELLRTAAHTERVRSVTGIVRARHEGELIERNRQILAYVDRNTKKREIPIHIIAGDITQVNFGLAFERYAELLQHTTHFIHAAADLNLGRALPQAIAAARGMTEQVLSFVRKAREEGHLRRVTHISTVGVAGEEYRVVPESRLRPGRPFRNSYEESKASVEEMMLAARDAGAPISICRPSMIIGRSTDGEIGTFQIFYRCAELWAGALTRNVVPDGGDMALDLMPVDIAARAILKFTLSERTPAEILHVVGGSAGSLSPLTLGEILRELRQDDTAPDIIPLPSFERQLATRVLGDPGAGALRFIPHVLPYLRSPQQFAGDGIRTLLPEIYGSGVDAHSWARRALAFYLDRTHLN